MSKNETFKTTEMGANGKVYHREVKGMRIQIGTRKCFVFKEEVKVNNQTKIHFNISDLFTGFRLVSCSDKKLAVNIAEKFVRTEPKRIKEAERKCDLLQIKTPVNI